MKKIVLLCGIYIATNAFADVVSIIHKNDNNNKVMCSSDTCGPYDQKYDPKTGMLYKPAYYNKNIPKNTNNNQNDSRAGRATSAMIGFGVGTGISDTLKAPKGVKLGTGLGAAGVLGAFSPEIEEYGQKAWGYGIEKIQNSWSTLQDFIDPPVGTYEKISDPMPNYY